MNTIILDLNVIFDENVKIDNKKIKPSKDFKSFIRQTYGNYSLILLSTNDIEYSKSLIESSKISKYFKSVNITSNIKIEEIHEILLKNDVRLPDVLFISRDENITNLFNENKIKSLLISDKYKSLKDVFDKVIFQEPSRNRLAVKMLVWYKSKLSPSLGLRCRYFPSCSHYSMGCYRKFNFFKATGLTIYRLLRCNPFSKGGIDNVPPTKEEKLIDLSTYKKS